MQLNFRNYQKVKTKTILKKNNFLLLATGTNQSSSNWITLEQNLYKLNLDYTKIYNTITAKILNDSIARKLKNTINSTFFVLKPKNTTKIIKSNLLNEININKFTIITIYLNKKLYVSSQLTKLNSFHLKKNVAILYQFLSTSLKSTTQFK